MGLHAPWACGRVLAAGDCAVKQIGDGITQMRNSNPEIDLALDLALAVEILDI